VARANLLAATNGEDGCFCIGTGVGSSVNQVFGWLSDSVGVRVTPRYGDRRAGDLRAAYFDVRKAQEQLGWRPTVSLQDGLRKTVEWFRAQTVTQAALV
jgi:UDP-glucose 4-epimerase